MDCPSPLLKTMDKSSSVHLMKSSSLSAITHNLSGEEDRISALPDHILLDILERVDDLLAVVHAGTLSRRWAHLPRSLSHLLIDIADFLPRDPSRRAHWTVKQVMTAYTAAVRSLLTQPPSTNRAIKRLQLAFYLTDPYLGYIGHAVGDAVEHGNTDLLEFVIYRDVNNDLISYEHCVVFGQRFMSFVQACPVAFRWLTRLVLHDLAFGDSHASTVLSSCRKLEHLSLNGCVCEVDHVTGEETVLTIDAPNKSLLGLEIITCAYAGINLVRAPKLGSLRCKDWLGADPPFRFGKVPCLDSVVLECSAIHGQNPFALSHFLSNITTLSIMWLDFYDQMIWIKPEGPKHLSPIFRNLRDVYNIFSECDLNWTMFVLEAAPSLNKFHLKLSCHPCERNACEDSAKKVNVVWHQASSDFKHGRLSLLQIIGFAVDEKLMKYRRHVIERAVGLRRIRLLDHEPCAKCDAMDAQSPPPIRWRFPEDDDEKKLIKQQLVDGLPSSAEISIG